MFRRSISEKEVERAADVLGLPWKERQQLHNYYGMERKQNRAANIALLKAIGRLSLRTLLVLGKVALVLFLLYLVLVGVLAL